MCVYGYCRISRKEQNIDRQERNIKSEYPKAVILKEAFTGTKVEGRKEFEKLMKTAKTGDTIVFDSVSRMSRNADEGITQYMKWFDMGVNLIFLKEAYINTSVYASKLQQADISTGKTYLDEGLKVILMGLAEEQIRIAFEQAEKEVQDLRQRTREGLETARLNGRQIGQKSGNTFNVKKKEPIIAIIREKSRDFNGTLSDEDVMKILAQSEVTVAINGNGKPQKKSAKVSRNTYYKYKKEAAEM